MYPQVIYLILLLLMSQAVYAQKLIFDPKAISLGYATTALSLQEGGTQTSSSLSESAFIALYYTKPHYVGGFHGVSLISKLPFFTQEHRSFVTSITSLSYKGYSENDMWIGMGQKIASKLYMGGRLGSFFTNINQEENYIFHLTTNLNLLFEANSLRLAIATEYNRGFSLEAGIAKIFQENYLITSSYNFFPTSPEPHIVNLGMSYNRKSLVGSIGYSYPWGSLGTGIQFVTKKWRISSSLEFHTTTSPSISVGLGKEL